MSGGFDSKYKKEKDITLTYTEKIKNIVEGTLNLV